MKCSPPPSRLLNRFCREMLPPLHGALSGRRMLTLARRIVATDRWNSFDRFDDTTRTLTEAYARNGVATELHRAPTGGDLDNGRWIIHEAADVRSATLEIVHPFRRRLLDFRRNPWCVIQWSNATPDEGVQGTLRILDTEEEVAALGPRALAGRLVLTRLDVRRHARTFYERGAVAVLADRGVKGLPDATAWLKFGWGSLNCGEAYARPVGFSLSTREGETLRKWAAERGKLTLRCTADLRRHIGHHDVLSGLVPGADDPQDEVWAIAHSAEPGAVDNASGVAVIVEVASVLERLIRSGALPRPRRTIRFVSGYECYGFFHYLEHGRRLQPPLAGLCVDSVGARADTCPGRRLGWYETVPASAGFVDDVGERILRAVLRRESAGYRLERRPFVATLDTLIGDPAYGFPCPWLSNHGSAYYHSSADVPAVLSPQGLAVAAAAVAGYLYFLAQIGTPETLEILEGQTARAVAGLDRLRRGDRPALADYARERHAENLRRLRRGLWGGERATVDARFRESEQRVAEATRSAATRLGVPRRAVPAGPRLAERRLVVRCAPLAPCSYNAPAAVAATLAGSGLPLWTHFWADGRRRRGEIRALAEAETGRDLDPRKTADHFDALEQLAFVRHVAPAAIVSERQLVRELRAIGVRPGMNVMVHSALSKIGIVAGGAPTMIRALQKAVGAKGTLLFPSFNHGRARVFNPLTTPTTNGAIPEAAWRQPDALRSVHPTHAFAAIGPRARAWLAGHLEAGAFGPESPLAQLIREDGFVLCLGVSLISATAYHVAEVSMPCRCLDLFGQPGLVVEPDGTVRRVPGMAWRAAGCPAPPMPGLTPWLARRRLLRQGRIGAADALLVRGADIVRARHGQLAGICPQCEIRPQRPAAPRAPEITARERKPIERNQRGRGSPS